jgi:hypothetical protein
MVLTVIFWVLLVLCAVGVFVPDTSPYRRGFWAILLIEIAILGLKVLDPTR